MIPEERRKLMLELIQSKRSVSVQELSKEFNITEVTVRRDLDILNKQGVIRRSHGGAILKEDKVGLESMFDSRIHQCTTIKELIGKKGASMVGDGDCIGIDIGTTAYEVARHLYGISDLTVITASIPVVCELMDVDSVNVICAGGELSRKDKSLIGHNAIHTIEEYILDKVFIGVAGLSFDFGFTLFNMNDSLVKRALIQRAREVIVVLDSSKINLTKHAVLCGFDEVDKIITDSRITSEDLERLQGFGIEVILVDEHEMTNEK